MSQTRRQFLKYASLAVGSSVFTAPYQVLGQIARGLNIREIQGSVLSGSGETAIPLAGVEVSLHQASSGAPRLLGTTTTNVSGEFVVSIDRPLGSPGGIFYITANLGAGLQLVSVIGPSLVAFVTINELTTVTAGYAMAQFTDEGVLAGDEFGLQIASGMNDNLVSPLTGESSSVLLSSPNGDETNSLRSTRALANLLTFFVRNGGSGVGVLFTLATPPGGESPENFLQALSNIARYPQQNVAELYALATQVSVYSPSLTSIPDAWTIVVKVNNTGSDEFLFGGPGNIAFDADGYAWITNNVVQGTPHSSIFAVVLKPDGQPADGTRGKPKSPLLGGGLLGGGYGVSIAPNGHIWFGNFGWGFDESYWPSPDGNGSVSQFTKQGHPISGSQGYQGGPVRAQAVMPDVHGNIWIASFGNDRVYVFPNGNPNRSTFYQEPAGSAPFDIQFARDGTAWVTNSGGLGPKSDSSIARYALTGGQLNQIFFKELGHSVKGVAVDSQGQGWVAAGGDDFVYLLSDQGEVLGQFNGGGINAPWGISVDGDDNVWVANFGPEAPGMFTTSCITKLAGSNPATRPPGLQTGDPISPPSGYTLPSAGAQVLLHNGEPLYGPHAPPSYTPLMRLTSVPIDRAGNIWATNNWKPDFTVDAVNSGGDGICIFVGLAKPPVRAS